MPPIVPPVPADVLAQIEAAGLTVTNVDDGLSFVQKLVRSDKSAVVSALLHAAILICLPRVFLGLHYASDVLVGAAIGIGMACVMNLPYVRTRVAAPVLTLARRYPGAFYAMAFILSFELAMQFDELRSLAQGLTKAL